MKQLKERVLTGWTWRRWLYVVMGVFITMQGIDDHQQLEIMMGLYVAAMGIFSFGCAAGFCLPQNKVDQEYNGQISETEFEEIKTKS